MKAPLEEALYMSLSPKDLVPVAPALFPTPEEKAEREGKRE